MTPSLSTPYLGLSLPSPIVAAASPLWRDPDAVARVAEAGAGAIVLPSLFEERVMAERLHAGLLNRAFAQAYHARLDLFPPGGEQTVAEYVALAERAVAASPVPVIASLNGVTPTSWVLLARRLADVGVGAIELNFYEPAPSADESGEDVERRLLQVVAFVAQVVALPVAVKLLPVFPSPLNLARRLRDAGARGIVVFNREYDPGPRIVGEAPDPSALYSSPAELGPRLRWATALAARGDLEVAVTGGVHGGRDVVRCLLAGAQVAQVCSVLLRHGPEHVAVLRAELEAWMVDHGVASVDALRGQWHAIHPGPAGAAERGEYARLLGSWHPRRRGGLPEFA